ncbi:MAG: fructose-bisphosphatase class III, partial [Eubacterium sp.]
MADIKFLELLSKDYPNIQAASAEIINLRAILALPKGTEYCLSDLHGEHEAFIHMLK